MVLLVHPKSVLVSKDLIVTFFTMKHDKDGLLLTNNGWRVMLNGLL